MFVISNIKISFKLNNICLDTVQQVCEEKKINNKKYPNFLVIRNDYTFIIFKKNNIGTNHVNATKIMSDSNILDCISSFLNIIDLKNIPIPSWTVDNITSNFSLNKKINLSDFIQNHKTFLNIKYQNEIFSGIFIKFQSGTAILFHSGNVVIIGCKNKDSIKWIYNQMIALTI